MTRQALSKTIHNLEEELGAPLFVRDASGVQPTQVARAIMPHVRRMLGEYEAIREDVRRHQEGLIGTLIVAVEPNAMMTLPTGAVAAYREARPGLSLTLTTAYGQASLGALASGAVDAVLSVPLGDESFAYDSLLNGELCLVFSDDRGSGASWDSEGDVACPIPLSFLDGRTLFGVAPDNPIEAEVCEYLSQRGVRIQMSYDYPSAALAMAAMRQGLGGCFVERSGVEALGPECAVVRLDEENAPRWEVGVTSRKGTSKRPIIDDFVGYLRAALKERS